MTQTDALRGLRLLVVEDNYMVAQVLIEMLQDAGATIIGPIGEVDEALSFIRTGGSDIDCAVLDIDLHGRKSYPIADALTERGVHVVFTTGFDANAVDKQYLSYPRCSKPFEERTILAALAACGRRETLRQE